MINRVISAIPARAETAPRVGEIIVPARRQLVDHSLRRDFLLVVGLALALRLLFMALTANTYDYDEFVLLLLARAFAHGSVPYRDFMFFHPPGALLLLRAIEPVTALWWPLARIFESCVDAATAVLVWRIGILLWDRRTGLAAGILYAISPVALISGVRVSQDPILAFLGVLGLYSLISRTSRRAAMAAGVCLACAVFVKYPAAYFLPVLVLASPRRAGYTVGSAIVTFALLLLPFHAQLPNLYQQTVTFQLTRWSMALDQRLETTVLFWLIASPLAIVAICLRRSPMWLTAAFLLGGVFAFSSQVYYHYFVVVVPSAALLGAPPARRLAIVVRRSIGTANTTLLLATAVVAGVTAWGELIAHGGPSPLFVTAAQISDVAPTVRVLKTELDPTAPVLADRFEYAYLAGLPAETRYFWNVGPLVNATYLERLLPNTGAVVLSSGASSGFPAGFTAYLDQRYSRIDLASSTVWLLGSRKEIMVGARGFEPPTSASRTLRATKLRHAPIPRPSPAL